MPSSPLSVPSPYWQFTRRDAATLGDIVKFHQPLREDNMNDLQLALAKDRVDRRIQAAERRHLIATLRKSRRTYGTSPCC